MYTLLSGLYKYMFQKDEYCILILGLDNAGKTTFLEQSKTRFNKNYKGMSLSKITTTVGLNIGTVDVGKARLMFWDLGGQEELQSLWDKYYAECHGVIYVIDSTDEERLSESKEAFEPAVVNRIQGARHHLSCFPQRRWFRVKHWTVSPSWCWPTSRMWRPASPFLTSRLHSVTVPARLAGETV
ncbi:ADP-ribosylation factor-related protein 1 isoform X2 [Meriones unguiculatus]|uniref:ADP-ribosylation factor-related protein 1 isoform X2 n=1 Tax=Meriones unguiculatus TaxID=10047 RepID=UPI000B4EE9FC|nr:ADP-ribosylation factor-related protein 1 isoform X2 [Meriones unguiculatus]XP_021502732.1 ADP-ribosylation factor-related protein 1 isoform X2 [Meriones unguiculatus]